jgi:hypothetical protein
MMAANPPARQRRIPRWLILGSAILLAVASMAILDQPVRQDWVSAAQAQPAPAAAPSPAPAKADAPAAAAAAPKEPADRNVGVTIRDNDRKVVVSGLGHKQEFDSFAEFVDEAPWIAGLVFLTVMLSFMVPLLAIVLVIWYKVRKTRMLNETMLKLAERGAVPPGEALDAIASNRTAAIAAAQSGIAPAPLYEQARALQRRNSWSDLRKGVIMTAAGLGLLAFSLLDDGTPNSVGLVLLFVGVGYIVLWYFEDRETSPRHQVGNNLGGGA